MIKTLYQSTLLSYFLLIFGIASHLLLAVITVLRRFHTLPGVCWAHCDKQGRLHSLCNSRLGSYSLAQIARRDSRRSLLCRKLSLGRFVLPILSWGVVSPFQGECCGLCGVHCSPSLGSLRPGCLEDWQLVFLEEIRGCLHLSLLPVQLGEI